MYLLESRAPVVVVRNVSARGIRKSAVRYSETFSHFSYEIVFIWKNTLEDCFSYMESQKIRLKLRLKLRNLELRPKWYCKTFNSREDAYFACDFVWVRNLVYGTKGGR
jgi:RNase P protein component